jgi:hypothetical protein
MSDIEDDESISEESIEYHSDENSEVYNPNNQSEDNFVNEKSFDKLTNLPGVKSLTNTSLSLVNYDKDDDDYVFDDFEDEESIVSQAYSNDFESAIDISKSSIPSPRSGKPSPRNRSYQNSTEKIYKDLSLKSLENKNNIPNSIKQFQISPKQYNSKQQQQQHQQQQQPNSINKNNYNPYNMPSIQLPTVQAELALDEISKEVLRLRNQQRTMLKERKQNAKSSKQRAEDRRLQYNEEMKNLKKIAQESTLTVTNMQEKIDGLEKQILSEQNTKQYLKETITSLTSNINVLEEKNENSQQEIQDFKSEIITIKKEWKSSEKEWLGDKRNLENSCQRAELLVSVMQKSTEENEARYLIYLIFMLYI